MYSKGTLRSLLLLTSWLMLTAWESLLQRLRDRHCLAWLSESRTSQARLLWSQDHQPVASPFLGYQQGKASLSVVTGTHDLSRKPPWLSHNRMDQSLWAQDKATFHLLGLSMPTHLRASPDSEKCLSHKLQSTLPPL